MAVLNVNTPGLASTDEGYISSITVYTGGSATVLTPDGSGNITVSAPAATVLAVALGSVRGIKLVTG